MNEKQAEFHKNTFNERYDHRMGFADFMVDYIDTIPMSGVSLDRVYAAYDTFQKRLCESELPDGELIAINEKGKPVVEMKKKGDLVLIRLKVKRKWADIRCPLELIKFADWWLYN